MDHGEIEQAAAGAQSRLDEQLPWLEKLPSDFLTVLDVGAGRGIHAKWLLDNGRLPTALDRSGTAFEFAHEIELLRCDLLDIQPGRTFDAIFCSHVLEHFPNPAHAIEQMRALLSDGGYLFIIVPPYEPVSVNYHWHTGWNASQLALFMVAMGFDCSGGIFCQSGLNVCGWGRKSEIPETSFNLQLSLPYLPKGMADTFFVKDGYEFIPGNLRYADNNGAQSSPEFHHFDFSSLEETRGHVLLFEEGSWQSIERSCTEPWDFRTGTWNLAVTVEGPEVAFRIALGCGSDGDPWSESTDRYLSARQGLSIHTFTAGDFAHPNIDMAAITHVSIGGTGLGESKLRFWCVMPNGEWL